MRRGGLGGVVGNVVTAVQAAANVVTDPYLPETTSLLLRLHQLEQGKPKAGTPAPAVRGIGLSKVVGPLRAYVKVREQPVFLFLGLMAVFAVPYYLGKASK